MVKSKEYDFTVNTCCITPARQPYMVGDGWCPEHGAKGSLWEQVEPGLDGGGLQHGVAVTHNRKPSVFDAIHGAGLLLDCP